MTTKTSISSAQAKNFRVREHRLSGMAIKDILKTRIKDLGLKNLDVQEALGYPNPNVIAMMKAGKMNLPPEKAYAAAAILQLDPVWMIMKALQESNAMLHDSIVRVLGKQLVSENEQALLDALRKETNGHDIDFVGSEAFMQATMPAVRELTARHGELLEAALARKD